MLAALQNFTDRLLGRGKAAITVPTMDGALKANRVLDEAEVAAELPGIDDLASADGVLWATAGNGLYRWQAGAFALVRHFDEWPSALAVSARGQVALALAGRRIALLDVAHRHEAASVDAIAGQSLMGVNGLSWQGESALVFSDGSTHHGPQAWQRDLMSLGRTGRVGRWVPDGESSWQAQGLAHAWGVLAHEGSDAGVWVSESWRHRVLRIGGGLQTVVLPELPGYPGRMARASAGGAWLAVFAGRTQLVEFVLREPEYRERMMAELAPEHWIAPALSSGHNFLEPLQGAGVKNMGVLKPWAPPRSYGLVVHVADDGRVLRSLHSQVDGEHHGITAVAEHDGALWCASKGSGRLLKVPLSVALQGERA